MVSKDVAAAPTMTAAQITAKAQAYFNALFKVGEVTGIAVTATYSSTGNTTLTMTGQGTIATQFLNVIGFPTLTFNTSSKTMWGTQALRVALALDVTGSMAYDGKIEALRTAATNLVTTLINLVKNRGDVYISLVPFSKDVNVGSANAGASWIDWTDWDAANSTQTCTQYFLFFCLQYTTTPKSHALWTGCVTDRTQDNDTKNTTPAAGIASTLYPAEEYYENSQYYCKIGNSPFLQPIMAMTYNWLLLKTNIGLLAPTGSTNQAIGLAWAWQTLTTSGPFAAPSESSSITYKKAIVLMSDGLNTKNRWYGNGVDLEPQVDARQCILCDNIKAANIEIHAVQVNTGLDPTSSVLQYCANPGNFQIVTSASQLISAFDKIGVSLTKLRIAQ